MTKEELILEIIDISEGEYSEVELEKYSYDELLNLWYQY